MIDDESLVKTRTNTCLSYTSAVPSYSVVMSASRVDSGEETSVEEVNSDQKEGNQLPCSCPWSWKLCTQIMSMNDINRSISSAYKIGLNRSRIGCK